MDSRVWDERYGSAELVWGAEPNRFVREQCADLPPAEAVDLACGEGRNALWLARRGWRVTGIDFSPVAIARAEQLTAQEPAEVGARVTWRVGDVTTGVLEPASADLVVIAYLHLPEPEIDAVLASAARAVRTGGTLLLVGHDKRNVAEGVGGPQDVALLHEPGHVRDRLRLAGLEVVTAATVERPTDQGTALDTLVRAARPA